MTDAEQVGLRARKGGLIAGPAPTPAPAVTVEKRTTREHRTHTTEEYIQAMEGSFGVVKTICKRLDITRGGLEMRCKKDPAVAVALKAARMEMVDFSESILQRNLRLAYAAQEPIINEDGTQTIPFPIDSSDAKWVLSRLGRERGWGTTVEMTGQNYGASDTVIWTPEQWKTRQEQKQLQTSEAETLLAEPVDYSA